MANAMKDYELGKNLSELANELTLFLSAFDQSVRPRDNTQTIDSGSKEKGQAIRATQKPGQIMRYNYNTQIIDFVSKIKEQAVIDQSERPRDNTQAIVYALKNEQAIRRRDDIRTIDFASKAKKQAVRDAQKLGKIYLAAACGSAMLASYVMAAHAHKMEYTLIKTALTVGISSTFSCYLQQKKNENHKIHWPQMLYDVGMQVTASLSTGVLSVLGLQEISKDFWTRTISQMGWSIGFRAGMTTLKNKAETGLPVNYVKALKNTGETFAWAAFAMAAINMGGRELADSLKQPWVFDYAANAGASAVSVVSLWMASTGRSFAPIQKLYRKYFNRKALKENIDTLEKGNKKDNKKENKSKRQLE